MTEHSSETIEYRGQIIDVAKTRDWLSRFKNQDGTPYYTPEQLEVRLKKEILNDKRMIGRLTGSRYEKNEGYRLAFYLKEKKLFPKAYEVKVSDRDAIKLVRKLLKHFGKRNLAKNIEVRFYGNRGGGGFGYRIRLSHNPSLGLVCHEVGHAFENKHTKKLMKIMKKLITYCFKNESVKLMCGIHPCPKYIQCQKSYLKGVKCNGLKFEKRHYYLALEVGI